MTRLTVAEDPEEAAAMAAELIATFVDEARAERDEAHLGLAGGSTPRRTYELLPGLIEDWTGIHLWFGDERAVPPDDERSNFRMVDRALLQKVAIRSHQVHRIAAERDPESAAIAYSEELRSLVPLDGQGVPVLDIALLGMGPDGHTASLFPNTDAVEVDNALCVVVRDAPKPPPVRITLTLPVLRAARHTIFLTTGAAKAGAIRAVLATPVPWVPASQLAGDTTELIVDKAAVPNG